MARLYIGLTGGVASGKSAAEAAFIAHGATVVDADAIARELVQPGQPALAEIAAHFGAEILDARGELDRARLRRLIFADAQAKAALEAILHPRIRAELRARCEAAETTLVIASVPLLAEGGGRSAYPWLDRILVIDVSPATQQARLMARDGIDATLAQRMIAAQASREARLAIADDILGNEDSLQDLQRRVGELARFYAGLAASRG
ncbi:dephospho-CoA kinase [Luteimonas sp. e5]